MSDNAALSRPQVIAAGICALVLTVGIARFAYTPLLPVMRAQTWLTEVAGGWLATCNYMGYMAGAMAAAAVGDLQRKFRYYRIGLVVAVLTTAAMGMTDNIWLWVLLRFVAGLAATAGLLIGSGLVLNWLFRHGHRPELGIHFGGIGVGVVVSGLAAAAFAGHLDWAQQWYALAALGVLLFLPAWFWLPAPVPYAATPAPGSALPARRGPGKAWMSLFLAAYFCAGFGFVVSATFNVAMVERLPELRGQGNMVWMLVGLAAAPSCFVWDHLSRRMGQIPAMLLAYVVQIVSIVMSALATGLVANIFAALLYGGSFVGIVSLALSVIGRAFPANPAKAMARLTLSYGVAQIVAPAMTGYIAQATGTYRGALLLAAGIMLAGMVCLVLMRRQPQPALV
ncbi:MAG: YbfB/YjiJ family MFS transporter [Rhodocyclaceae bacterium]|nr:YbfB/YjiJ family MFS transporter [Rhodocyclaceae bacterium]MBX3669824.1 YbfB/YjiJ family MFS transporter [Rhodocyclaceae bacterium]